ncbi:splicing factor 3a, subunit 3, partial [Haematococcus lacustris]
MQTAAVKLAENDEALLKEEPTVEFTGEEGLGRYLDLHALFAAFQNAKFGSKTLEYYEFVTGLGAHLGNIPRHFKMGAAYREYATSLLNYLLSFYERTQPLAQIRRQMNKAGTLTVWQDQGLGVTPQAGADHPSLDLDLAAFDSVEELEALGAERVKEALSSMGLKCGGTPRERALRLWLTRGKPLHELDRKLFAKGVAPPPPANGAAAPASNGTAKSAAAAQAKQKAAALTAAVLEAKVVRMCELLSNVIADTKGRVEKRQGQTYEEMMAEQEDAVEEAAAGPDEGSDAEDEFVYNPLKLPLGWDGKPIPYWLYKLHGLNQEFKCEVCGNFSYWGRRAYEKHFKEFRHQNGMRALGIPNNKNFFEVTKIADAQKLWEDIQLKQKGGFKAETEEEYEDAAGNVYNKRTYLDLKKQGII